MVEYGEKMVNHVYVMVNYRRCPNSYGYVCIMTQKSGVITNNVTGIYGVMDSLFVLVDPTVIVKNIRVIVITFIYKAPQLLTILR